MNETAQEGISIEHGYWGRWLLGLLVTFLTLNALVVTILALLEIVTSTAALLVAALALTLSLVAHLVAPALVSYPSLARLAGERLAQGRPRQLDR